MAKKKKVKDGLDYKGLHKSLTTATEEECIALMQSEVSSKTPRADFLSRVAGRFNRLRGRRVTTLVLGLMSKSGKKDVRAAILRDN